MPQCKFLILQNDTKNFLGGNEMAIQTHICKLKQGNKEQQAKISKFLHFVCGIDRPNERICHCFIEKIFMLCPLNPENPNNKLYDLFEKHSKFKSF
jgi:hypothetical protein